MRLLGVIAGATLVLHVVCIEQYGYFRDELYYLACGEHLDWGYVDQPPLIALIAFLIRRTLGESLFAIRILPAIAGASLVLLTGHLAKMMGARRFAQFLAALAAMIVPISLATSHFLSMNAFEPLFWMGMVAVALSIFNGASPKRWMLFGAIAGLALQNKHTTLFFGAAFVVGLLLSPHRRHLRSPWMWAGGAIAFLIFLPNLIWQVQHDFATVELLRNIDRSTKNTPVTPWSFFTGQLILMNPITAPIWIAGIIWLLRSAKYRALAFCWLALFTLFVVMRGKIYYLSPSFPMLLAAGAAAIEEWTQIKVRWLRPLAATAVLIFGALLAPLALPILPVNTFIAYQNALGIEAPETETHRKGPLPQQYADMFGWPEMAAVVAKAYHSLSPDERARCAIFGQNYGQAGAIDLFGPRLGLPKALSAHQNYFLWGPRGYSGDVMLVMDDDRETLQGIFESVEQVGIVDHPLAMPYERQKPLHLCRGIKVPLPELWPRIKKWI